MTTLVLLAILAQAVSIPTPPGAAEEQKGTAAIRGRILAAESGRPLRGARITVSAAGVTRSTSTNSRGEYEVKDLPAGRFTISAARSGYMRLLLGQRHPDDVGRPVSIVEGQLVEKVDLALPRMGLISGRVVDETGEPVQAARVHAVRYEFFRGRRRLVPVGSDAQTDDTGRYRLLNMPPGEFLVTANLRDTWVAGPERHVFAYSTSFFPSVASAREAARVKVALGQETPNVDIALVASRAAVLSGTATLADGSPLAGASVSLNVEVTGPTGGTSYTAGSVRTGADGSWLIRDVPPGDYQLAVTAGDRGGAQHRASMPISVQGTEVRGITLVADAGGTLTGTVVAEGGRPLPGGAVLRIATLGVGPDTPPFAPPGAADNGRVQPDGRFTLTGVLGPSMVRVNGLPRGWDIERIESSGRDLTDLPIEVTSAHALDVTIVLSDRLPSVQGRATDAKGEPAEGVVLLFPSDAAKWADAAAIRSSRLDASGTFRYESLRPGDYLAVALESAARWQVADPEFLEAMRTQATAVTLRVGESEQLTLRVR
jgi:hypothetical protein